MNSCDHKFVDSNRCAKCGWSVDPRCLTEGDRELLAPPTYTDDIVAVMRDTISAQRETIDAKNRTIEALQTQKTDLIHEVARLRARIAQSPLPEGM